MNKSLIEARGVRERAAGRWIDMLAALAPALGPALSRPGRHVPCPVHGGTDGFRLFRDVDDTGGGVCNTCGTFHDGFALLMWVNRWSFPETLQAVAHELGMTDDRVPEPRRVRTPRPRSTERDRESVIEALNRVWQQSLDPADRRAAPLRSYLSRRGLAGVRLDGGVVRFHPALGYWQRNDRNEAELVGRYPAMVALVTGADGAPVTVHRTYLTPDGRKAAGAGPKEADGLPRRPPGRRGHPAVRSGANTGCCGGHRDRACGAPENGDARLVGGFGRPARAAGAARGDRAGRGLGGSGPVRCRRGGSAVFARAAARTRDPGRGPPAPGADPGGCEGDRLGGRLGQLS